MSRNKFFSSFLVAGCVAAQVVMPGIALAHDGVAHLPIAEAEVRLDGEVRVAGGVCARIKVQFAQIDARLKKGMDDLGVHRNDAMEALVVRRDTRENKIKLLREKEDKHRDEVIAELEVTVLSTAQKEALAEFKVEVAAAVEARRKAIDAANTKFQAGLRTLAAERKSKVDAILATYKASVRAAVSGMEGNCTRRGDAEAVAKVRAELQAAKDKFKSDMQAVEKIGTRVQVLIDAHKEAQDKAVADFKAAMEKARVELKAALNLEVSS